MARFMDCGLKQTGRVAAIPEFGLVEPPGIDRVAAMSAVPGRDVS
jgi:hypothetical protein